MITQEKIEQEVIQIVDEISESGALINSKSYLQDDLKLSKKDVFLIQDRLEDFYDIIIYSEDSSKWSAVEDITVSVCDALTEQGYIVVPREDIESI